MWMVSEAQWYQRKRILICGWCQRLSDTKENVFWYVDGAALINFLGKGRELRRGDRLTHSFFIPVIVSPVNYSYVLLLDVDISADD